MRILNLPWLSLRLCGVKRWETVTSSDGFSLAVGDSDATPDCWTAILSAHMVFFVYIFTQRAAVDQIPAFDFLQSRKWLFYIYIFLKMQLWWQRPLQRCGTVLTSAVFLCICQETVVLLVGSFTFYMTFDLYATWPLMVCVAVLLSHTRPAPHRHGVNVFYLIVYGRRKKMSSRNKNNAGFSAAVRRRRRGRGLTPICWPHLWTRCCHSVTNRSGSTSLWENPFLKAVWASMFPRKGLTVCLVTTVL